MRTTYSMGGIFLSVLMIITSCLYAQDVSVFQPTDGPAGTKFNDGQGITAGMKFRSSQNGYINGIRYYKAAGSTGTHTGTLWSSTGSKLGEGIFVNETASGWQQVLFNTPVSITAGTTYIASYHSASGDYVATNPYFTQAVVNGPLHALANGEDGPNGVYNYSVVPFFPSSSFQSPNYWVDVVFSTTFTPDINPPVVASVSPAAGSPDASVNSVITVAFNEEINTSTVTSSSFQLKDGVGNVVAATVNGSFNQAKLTPFSALINSTTYTATIKGGSSGVKDISGNALANDYTWSFTTVALPTPEGHGGPILVLGTGANPFSRYAAEILRAEGLNGFITKDITQTSVSDIANYDVVILGEMNLTPAHVTMLTDWVNGGGTLIAFRPAVELSSLLGITKVSGTVADQYVRINTASGPGAGIVGETIQFHGQSDIYTLNGATSLATLYLDATTALPYPAVTTRNAGSNGGKAIAFTYDLAKSIIYTRQGNPAWAGQKRDGTAGPIRSDDMFFGINTPHWNDFNKISIPQADEQQRLLTNIILQGNLHRKPLPRFWFLPSGHKAAIVMTGDDHHLNGTTGQFNHFMTLGPNTPQDVLDWKAIRGTSYIYTGTMSNAQASAFETAGFEIALHLSTGCANFTSASLQGNMNAQIPEFTTAYPGVPKPTTNRNHCIAWSDWATAAKSQAQNGMRLDVNYYYWPASFVQNRPGMFTGSGMPMRFADLDGTMIDCYQVTTQMTDEAGINYTSFTNSLLDKALGPEGYYGVFCTNMHTDSSVHSGANAIIASAIAHQVPVISARQLLTWLDGRNNSYFGDLTWSNGVLSFTITAGNDARNLKAMLPLYSANGQLNSITRDGSSLSFTIETIKGMQYAFFPVAPGTAAYVANYNTGPVVVAHPEPLALCEGNEAGFKSAASGDPSPTVQWQVSTDGGTNWTNIAGATETSLTFVPTAADNGNQYRAVWTNAVGTVMSNAALLTVSPVPFLTSSLTGTATSGEPFNYVPTSSAPGTTFTWSRAAVPGISNPAASGAGSIRETLINTTGTPVIVKYIYRMDVPGCFYTELVTVTVYPQNNCSVTSSIVFNFNSVSIRRGRYIWFNSIFDPSSLGNSGPVHFKITNSRITYRVNNQDVVLNVPDAQIKFDAGVQLANTQYAGNKWKTTVPLSYSGNVFMTGLSYLVPDNLPGNISNIKWTATISCDKPGVSVTWKWAAAVYSNFAGNAGLSVKSVDGPLQVLNTNLTDKAGTPVNYKLYVTSGATGDGLLGGLLTVSLLNYTGNYSNPATVSCASGIRMTGRSGSEEIVVESSDERLDVTAMPNPSVTYFSLLIKGSGDKTASVRILDMLGRVVERYESVRLNSVLKLGERWKGGTYMAEVIQGDQRKIIKLVKAN